MTTWRIQALKINRIRRQIMNRKDYQVAFPTALVVVMVAFLSAIFFANANLSFADSGKQKSSAVAKTSAVEQTEVRIKQLHGALKRIVEQPRRGVPPEERAVEASSNSTYMPAAPMKARCHLLGSIQESETLQYRQGVSTRSMTPISWHSPPKCLHDSPWPNSCRILVTASTTASQKAL